MESAFKHARTLHDGEFLIQYTTELVVVLRARLLDDPRGLGALFSACSAEHRALALGTSNIWVGWQFELVQAARACAQADAAYTQFTELGSGFEGWSQLSFERMLLWCAFVYRHAHRRV